MAAALASLGLLGNEPFKRDMEPGRIGERKIHADTPITAARREHAMKRIDQGRPDNLRRNSKLEHCAVPFVYAGDNRTGERRFFFNP